MITLKEIDEMLKIYQKGFGFTPTEIDVEITGYIATILKDLKKQLQGKKVDWGEYGYDYFCFVLGGLEQKLENGERNPLYDAVEELKKYIKKDTYRYIAAIEWRGRLNIKSMRVFDSLKYAKEYILSIESYMFRIYRVGKYSNKLVLTEKTLAKEGYKYNLKEEKWEKL